MPRIRVPETAQANVQAPYMSAMPRGSTGTNALVTAGAALDKVSEFLAKKKEQDDVLWANKSTAEGRLNWTVRSDELEKAAEPGAPGYVSKVMQEFGAYKEKALENAPDSVRDRYATALTELETSVIGRALNFEARERGAKVVADTKSIFAANQNVAMSDPSQLPALLQSTTATLDGLKGTVEPSVLQKLHDDAVGDLYHSAYAGEFNRALTSSNPVSALGALKRKMAEPVEQLRLRPQDHERLLTEITQAEVRIRRQAEADAKADVVQATSLLMAGIAARPPAGLGMVDAETRATYQSAQRAYLDGQAAWTNSPQQNAALLAGIEREMATARTNDQLVDLHNRRRAVVTAIQQSATQFKNDPAAYVRRMPEVAAAEAEYQKLANDLGNAQDEASKQRLADAKAKVFSATGNAQMHLGAQVNEVYLLTDDQVRGIGGQVQKINSTIAGPADLGKAAEQTQALFHQIVSDAGPYAPNIIQQLVAKKAISQADALAMYMGTAPQALDLLVAARRDKKELHEAVGGANTWKALELGAAQQVGPLMQAMRAQGNYQLADNLGASVATLAAHYKSQSPNMGESEAVARASEYWDRRFQVATYNGGSYFFPNTYNPGQITTAIDRYVRDVLPAKDLMVPPGFRTADPEEWKKQTADYLRARAIPVTNADSSGITFRYNTYGMPAVRDAQGQPVTVTWNELATMDAGPRRGKLPRNQYQIPDFEPPPGQP